MSYATRNRRPPRTLTHDEVSRILKVTGEHRDGFRDHVILSLALGCGLRESEIVGLDVGDVLTADGRGVRKVVQLRVFKRAGEKSDPKAQRVHLPESTYYKLEKYARVERLRTAAAFEPIFVSRKGNRLSVRAVRGLFARWQRVARFDHRRKFHELRHTAITLVYRRTRDIRLTQVFARHSSVETTMIYTHGSDEELASAVRGLPV